LLVRVEMIGMVKYRGILIRAVDMKAGLGFHFWDVKREGYVFAFQVVSSLPIHSK
jgi:chemotaxis signal transduction protein